MSPVLVHVHPSGNLVLCLHCGHFPLSLSFLSVLLGVWSLGASPSESVHSHSVDDNRLSHTEWFKVCNFKIWVWTTIVLYHGNRPLFLLREYLPKYENIFSSLSLWWGVCSTEGGTFLSFCRDGHLVFYPGVVFVLDGRGTKV